VPDPLASSRLHLDLHVDDPAAAADRAVSLGASVRDRPDLGYVVLRSPGGLTFCNVSHRGAEIPAPTSWPGVRRSRVYQACLDIPSGIYVTDRRHRPLGGRLGVRAHGFKDSMQYNKRGDGGPR